MRTGLQKAYVAKLRRLKVVFGYGLCCLVGDFDAISRSSERRGLSEYSGRAEVAEFKKFYWGNGVD